MNPADLRLDEPHTVYEVWEFSANTKTYRKCGGVDGLLFPEVAARIAEDYNKDESELMQLEHRSRISYFNVVEVTETRKLLVEEAEELKT